MSNKVNRRDFLKIGGISTGVALGSALVKPIKKASAITSSDFKYRDRSNRYPWWVKTVDKPTNEYDLDDMTQYSFKNNVLASYLYTDAYKLEFSDDINIDDIEPPDFSLSKYIGGDEWKRLLHKQQDIVIENIENNVPGYTLRDKALQMAMYTYFDPTGRRDMRDGDASFLQTPEYFGVKRWEGTEEEASDMVEAAGKAFGAAQVAYCAAEPKWMWDNVKFSSSVDEITQKDGKTIIPERFKYVINVVNPMPLETSKLAPTHIGGAGEITAYLHAKQATVMIMNFIKSLGYQAMFLPGLNVPHLVMAGVGEIGRISRCISPIYGANIRTWCLITDMPLAIDKPIDFGLQEFCKGCKICAEACPAGAISMDDEPSYSDYPWAMPGKKAYHEDGTKCRSFMLEHGGRCCVCTVSCPWSRPIGSALHDLSGPVGAKIPGASSLLAKMHDVFGYGTQNDSESLTEWWDLDLPSFGYETFKSK